MNFLRRHLSALSLIAAFMLLTSFSWAAPLSLKTINPPKKSPAELRSDYLARLMTASGAPPAQRTTGSLWSPEAVLSDLSSDYKARLLHDTVIVQVSVLTNAAQSGAVDSSRTFSTNSAITGLLGALTSSTTNPLLAANSASALKGSGQTRSNTTFTTDLAGEVIAVLPNGNLVVEARRQIAMNHQHE